MHSSIKDLKYQNFVMDNDKLDELKQRTNAFQQSTKEVQKS